MHKNNINERFKPNSCPKSQCYLSFWLLTFEYQLQIVEFDEFTKFPFF